MNRTLGSTLLVAGTMIGAGMLAMPLTAAGLGLSYTIVLICALWLVLTYSALLFVEAYQTAHDDAGIGSLTGQYFGVAGRTIVSLILLFFQYALLTAYSTGGGQIFASLLPQGWGFSDSTTTLQVCIVIFGVFFGIFITIGTSSVDVLNRILFFIMLIAFVLVLVVMFPKIQMSNLMHMPLDKALFISASPVFFTAFGFHGSIPSLNRYLGGNVKALRLSFIAGSLITVIAYLLWQVATHGVLTQVQFMEILRQDPTLGGLVKACRQITGSAMIATIVGLFSALALITSFLGVALGLFECIYDVLKRWVEMSTSRLKLGLLTFVPPILFAILIPNGFVTALSYAGQMFAFYAVVLPALLVWRVRVQHPNLPYRVWGGYPMLVLIIVLGIVIACIPFFMNAGYLPKVVG